MNAERTLPTIDAESPSRWSSAGAVAAAHGAARPGSLLAVCSATCIAEVMLLSADQPTGWLQATAQAVLASARGIAGVSADARTFGVRCGIATADWATGEWRLSAMAESGIEARANRAQLLSASGTGTMDVSGLGGVPAAVPARDGLIARRDLIGDAQWRESPIRLRRLALGVDEFLRLGVSLSAAREPARLLIQLDRMSEQAWPEEALGEFLCVVGPHLAQAYSALVAGPQTRRQMLLQRISPVQRQILPLLVEGKTEREIALAMHRSPHTIHDHVKTIYAELGISSRFELLDLWSGRHAPGMTSSVVAAAAAAATAAATAVQVAATHAALGA